MKRYSSHAGRPRRGAFTLIEMLVVVVILVIVITLVVNVGSYIRSSAQEKKMRSWETLIMTAVQAYYDKVHAYPVEPFPSSSGTTPKYTPVCERDPSASSESGALARSELLYTQLMAVRESKDKLAALTNDAIASDSASGTPGTDIYPRKDARYFCDSNGITFDYRASGGMGGGPVVISAGADKLHFPTTDGKHDNAEDDNIRSDRQ